MSNHPEPRLARRLPRACRQAFRSPGPLIRATWLPAIPAILSISLRAHRLAPRRALMIGPRVAGAR
ncbi:MAG: hypothetical protein VB131_08395 [Burkholderia gladioli]